MDEIDALVEQGKEERAKASARQHTPEAKAQRNRGRAQRNRGYRAEKRVESRLAKFGFERVPLSGAAGGSWRGDLRRRGEGKAIAVVEVKHRKNGWATLRKWLAQGGGVDVLCLDEGAAKDILFVLPEKIFLALLSEAGYETEGKQC